MQPDAHINTTRMGSILAALSAVITSGYAVWIGLVGAPVFAFCASVAVLVAFDNLGATVNPRSTFHVLITPILIGAVVVTIPLQLALLADPDRFLLVLISGFILVHALLVAFVSLFVVPDEEEAVTE